jgi:hypothetical protein
LQTIKIKCPLKCLHIDKIIKMMKNILTVPLVKRHFNNGNTEKTQWRLNDYLKLNVAFRW